VLLEPFPEPELLPQTVTVTVFGAQDEVDAGAELVVAQRASISPAIAAPTRAEVMAMKRILMYVLFD